MVMYCCRYGNVLL